MKAIRRFSVRTVLPSRIEGLGVLASNLRWSWHPPTRDLFESISPRKWAEAGEDPVKLLSRLSSDELAALAADDEFVGSVVAANEDLHHYLTDERWYQSWSREQEAAGKAAPAAIAYFSPEFGITAVLPQYSGGLGILAGDHLKTASDLGVPIVGVGLFYKTGYFKQSLNRDGWQVETYPVLDPDGLPLSLLREEDGTPAVVTSSLPAGRAAARPRLEGAGRPRAPAAARLRRARQRRDRPARSPSRSTAAAATPASSRSCCSASVACAPCACGRACPAPRRRRSTTPTRATPASSASSASPSSSATTASTFDEALEAVRAATVFTTHTPVPAGIDRFDAAKINLFFGGANAIPGVPVERLLALGAEDYAGGQPGIFNMAVMGLRLAQRANGVSQLHGVVSREMFDGLWPGFDDVEVPITSITNGVHAPTWVDRAVYDVARKHLGTADIAGAGRCGTASTRCRPTPSGRRSARCARSSSPTPAAASRSSWQKRGASDAELGWVDDVLDPDVLTIGFARRVPTYKRLTLMLRDPERLKRLLLHPERPVQLVIAGKSHPADETGKRLIQEMVRFADDPEVRHRIVFLPNYDIAMAQHLYPGCDVWLNNPLRPFEACGTSGMKAALNGGLNLSILDGWWDEWFDGRNGWAIPTADGVEDADRRDDIEASALYDLIENDVAAKFYDRDAAGLPQGWIAMMTHTLKTLGPKVLASRMVQDYTEQLYSPAAGAGRSVDGPEFAGAKDLAAYKAKVRARVAEGQGRARRALGRVGLAADRRRPRPARLRRPRRPRPPTTSRCSSSTATSTTSTSCGAWRSPRSPLVESYDDGRHQFAGSQPLRRTGSFGYSVARRAEAPGARRTGRAGTGAQRLTLGRRESPDPAGSGLSRPDACRLPGVADLSRSRARRASTPRPSTTPSPAHGLARGSGAARRALSQSSSYAVAPGAVGSVTSTVARRPVDDEQHRLLPSHAPS